MQDNAQPASAAASQPPYRTGRAAAIASSAGTRRAAPLRSSVRFSYADQPDIVRAAQKDDMYRRALAEQAFDVFSRIVGPRLSMSKQKEVRLATDLAYYSLNTLAGSQTLGEEYCDILQIEPRRHLPPGTANRIVLVFWHVVVPYLVDRFWMRIMQFTSLADYSLLAPHLKDILPKLSRLHLTIFYFTGKFYDLSKRLTNIQYVFNRKVDQRRPKYHILGILILIQFVVSGALWVRDNADALGLSKLPWAGSRLARSQIADLTEQSLNIRSPSRDRNGDNSTKDSSARRASGSADESGKCMLCLEQRRDSTSTACGHLFCWECVAEWCATKPECPLCRQPLTMQSLVPLYGY